MDKLREYKVAGLLAGIIAFNVLFPLTTISLGVEIVFYFGYSVMLVGNLFIAEAQRWERWLGIVLGVATFLLGVVNAVGPFRLS